MINLGNIELADLRLGASQVKAAYFGSKQIWGGEEPVPVGDWLCFTAEQANSTVKLYKYNGGAPTLDIETSTNGSNWSAYTQGTVLTAANIGDTIYFRAGSTGNPTVSTTNKTNRFAITGKMAASGDIQYLLSQDGTTQPTADWCFNCLFYGQRALTEPPKCGATTLGAECYGGTFEGCSNLRYAPALPATTLARSCYINMFKGCSSLTTAPALPATTLAENCYTGMFNGCSSLTTAPALPATTLVHGCYSYMFQNCSSLTSAPALPAMTLASDCYYTMFSSCTSLSSVEVAFTAWNPSGATTNWLNNVASSGTFTCPDELPDTRGASNIPEGWTVAHPAPAATPLCFTAEGNGASVTLRHGSGAPSISMEYSTDNESWDSYALGTTVTLASKGDKVYFRAADVNAGTGNSNRYRWEENYNNYFDCQNVSVSGKLVSVLRKDMDESLTYTDRVGVYKGLLRNYKSRNPQIVSARDLQLPQLSAISYQAFFGFFTNSTLSAAPILPTNCSLAEEAMAFMFEDCDQLSSIDSPMTTITGFAGPNPFGNIFVRMDNFNQEELVLVLSGIADYPSNAFSNVFENNTSFTGKFILDMTSYTSVPTIQSNTFNNNTKPANGTLEIHVPASLYDTWKNATNWTTWSSYLVPVGVPTQDLKLHFDAIDNAGVGSHLSSTSDWANIAPDTSADYKMHRTTGTWEDDSAVFTGAYDECFWLRNSSNAQIDNLFSSLDMLSSSWTYAIGLYYNPATIENYRGYIGKQQSYTSYAQIYLRTDLQVSWLLLGYKQNGTSTGSQDTYFEGSAPNFKDSFTQNAFNTMVGTWDAATATFKVYVNGQLEFTWQSPGGAVVLGHELPLTLGGGQQQSGNNRTCKGKIHDFLVYSRALSDAEVAQLHAYQDARFNS